MARTNGIEGIYRRHVQTVYRVCYSYLGSAADAEDAVGEMGGQDGLAAVPCPLDEGRQAEVDAADGVVEEREPELGLVDGHGVGGAASGASSR